MFKDRLRQARNASGLTQIEFAEALGISSSTIAGYETGRSEPDFQRLVDMMKVLNVDANFLFQDEPASMQEQAIIGAQPVMAIKDVLNCRSRELGMSIDDVARASGVSRSMVSKVFNGISVNPRYCCLYAIVVHGLGISMDEFNTQVFGEAPIKPKPEHEPRLLSAEAERLADDYDRLDERGQNAVRALADAELDAVERQSGNIIISEDDRKRLLALAEQVRAEADRRKNRARQDALPGDAG